MNLKAIFCLALVLSGNCDAAIVYPKGPEGGRQIICEKAGPLLQADPRTLGRFRMKDLTIADLTIAEPHRNYVVGPADLASGHLLSAAESSCWRYILMHGTNVVGVAELSADAKTGKGLEFAGLYDTGFAEETLEALREAEKLPQIQKQDYEIRFLDIPAVHFCAVWLHGKSDDIVIPLPPTFGKWNAYQPYSESQMIKLLQPMLMKDMYWYVPPFFLTCCASAYLTLLLCRYAKRRHWNLRLGSGFIGAIGVGTLTVLVNWLAYIPHEHFIGPWHGSSFGSLFLQVSAIALAPALVVAWYYQRRFRQISGVKPTGTL